MAIDMNRIGNVIHFGGSIHFKNIPCMVSEVYKAIDKCKFEDIILDFSKLESAFADAMVPFCANILQYQSRNIEFECILPHDQKLRRQFSNTNWSNIIDCRHEKSKFKGYSQYPTSRVSNYDELSECVDGILDCAMRASRNIAKNDFATIEWSLNEILENILRHSESTHGGLIHLSKFSSNKKCIEVVVADCGIGIPNSLKNASKYSHLHDYELVALATEEGVTNGKGMGNGLFGAKQLSVKSKGYFKLYSGYGMFIADATGTKGDVINIKPMTTPYTGTTVCFALDYSEQSVLEKALAFKGDIHRPVSVYLETKYTDPEDENFMKFNIAYETHTCSTRVLGQSLRNKIENFIKMENPTRIIIDCENAPNMSSSFADEFFGKLLVFLGYEQYHSIISVQKISSFNKTIYDRAIGQRAQSIAHQH